MKMIRKSPADHPSAEAIQHHSQISELFRQTHIGMPLALTQGLTRDTPGHEVELMAFELIGA